MRDKETVLLEMKKYFEEMKETCEKMLFYTNRELKKIRVQKNKNKRRKNGKRRNS